MIVVFHMFYGWQANWGFPPFMLGQDGELRYWAKFVETAIHNFSFGVDIFFLVSGFLITYLLLFEKEKSATIDVKKFYMRRLLRIWPLYFLTVAFGPLLTYLFNEPAPGSYFMHLVFLGNFELIQNGMSSSALNHLWSICIEEHFYLVCPLLVAFIPTRWLTATFLTIILISFAYRGIISGTENYWMNMYMNTIARMDVLAIGCLAGLLYWKGVLKFELARPVLGILGLLFLLLFINEVYVYWDNYFLATFKKYPYVLLAGVFIGNLLFNKNMRLMPQKQNFLHYLGKVSYGIYMFNPIVIAVFIKLFHQYQTHNGWLYFFGVNLCVLLVVVISFELFEKRFLSLKEKFAVVKSRKY